MNLCIPINNDDGLNSPVCAHFGSAPAFMVVDLETNDFRVIGNANSHDSHGMCTPLASFEGQSIDGLVIGGIGAGALNKLSAAGIRVYRSTNATVGEAVAAFRAGELQIMEPAMACGGHTGHSCH